MAKVVEEYKGHRAGTTKNIVHRKFDEKGADAAIKLAMANGIKEATAKTWCSFWKNNPGGKKTAKKAAAPKKAKTAKKAAPKKVAKPAKKAAPKKKAAPRVRATGNDEPAQAAA